MSRIVSAEEGPGFSVPDGLSWTAFEPDPSGRIRITGWDGEGPQDWQATHATTHTLDEIDEIADRLKAMTAHARGRRVA